MRRINVNLYPKDGYWFKNTDGARIIAATWGGVMARLAIYRKRAGQPAGDPEREVMEQACQRNPSFCTTDDGTAGRQLKAASLKGRLLAWLNGIISRRTITPLEFVSQTDAANRANVCAGCPMNTALAEGCSSCKAALRELRKNVIGGRIIDSRINGCVVTGEDLPTTVWLNEPTIENAELPAHCWRKRTL